MIAVHKGVGSLIATAVLAAALALALLGCGSQSATGTASDAASGASTSAASAASGAASAASDASGEAASAASEAPSTSSASSSSSSSAAAVYEDGVYEPSSFGWSGGSGRLKGITCSQVRISDGEAWATIAIESPNYTYVRVGETQYDCTVVGDTSVVEIPVAINANTTIYGCTSAMSSPHEIEYKIAVVL